MLSLNSLKSLLLNFQTHFFLIPPHYTFSFDRNELAEKALDYFILFIPCFFMIYLTVENFRGRLISRNTQFTIFFIRDLAKRKNCVERKCVSHKISKYRSAYHQFYYFFFFTIIFAEQNNNKNRRGAGRIFKRG